MSKVLVPLLITSKVATSFCRFLFRSPPPIRNKRFEGVWMYWKLCSNLVGMSMDFLKTLFNFKSYSKIVFESRSRTYIVYKLKPAYLTNTLLAVKAMGLTC